MHRMRAPQLFAVVFEDRWIFRRERRKVVDGLIRSRREASGSDVVT